MSEIELQDVEKRYGSVTALNGVSLSVDRGETVGLIGCNGAGKTTLFKMLVGHETPDAGTVSVGGLTPDAGATLRERVGYLPESAGFPPSFTGREVLTFHAEIRGLPADEREHRVERVLHTVGLDEAADRPVGGYSNGMNRRLGLATTLVGDPDVLLLDEPTAALDPVGVSNFHDIIEALAEETDITILVTSHVLSEIERLCDRVVILDDGSVRVAGDVTDLRRTTGDAVTVTATVEDDAATVAERVASWDGVTTATADPPRLRLDCDRDRVFDVLDRLRDATAVVDVEISEPGLDAVFRDAVTASRGVALSTGGERDD
ncbi:Cu-processing system ATP-binding protein [Haloplanus vescus]|uniref:Cu-processing system ATP-binding protein n=1 Tax=Haloplanus vescus TaxID=555874 RepID=A0A1H3W971_9EURY|nr:ABC transporter ATP-binding protein [Haloplanus vescus]SDZ83520.1 Cu-processing system ATP-binding protein [Haloplanus vescus]